MAPREGVDPFTQPFVLGSQEVAGQKLPNLGTALVLADHLGAGLVRWGFRRHEYLVEPALYTVGKPDESSPVLVTANYKLSFDILRRELTGQDLFILVLETMGINVWCAAGKGTFGTEELCRRIEKVRLDEVVSHRRLIVPQLGAPGVAAHEVKERTGFRVKYGPVEARDIPHFLERGRATAEMRHKRFPIGERLVLVPMELVPALKYMVPIVAAMALFTFFLGPAGSFAAAALAMAAALLCGAVLSPALLPWIPGRAFAVKGALLGLLMGAPATLAAHWGLTTSAGWYWPGAALSLFVVTLSSFMAMNFTGASTYTSLSGVEREMKRAVPLQAVGALVGVLGWVLSLVLLV